MRYINLRFTYLGLLTYMVNGCIRKGYELENINTAIDEHAHCYSDMSPITAEEQQRVIAELEKEKKVPYIDCG